MTNDITNDELRRRATEFLASMTEVLVPVEGASYELTPIYEAVLRVLDEHKLMREALEEISAMGSWEPEVGSIAIRCASSALNKVTK